VQNPTIKNSNPSNIDKNILNDFSPKLYKPREN